MADPRELTDAEAQALGLAPREMSDAEAAALGLAEAPKPAPAERDGAVRFLTGDGQHSALTRVMAPFRSAAQVLTLGAADEIGGGLAAGIEHLGSKVGIGQEKPFKQRLAEKIDEYRRLDREAEQASPVGTSFGQVTSMLAPVGAIGNAVSTAGKIITSVGLGAAGGFLGSEGTPVERLPGAVVGAGLGLGTGALAAGKGGEVAKYVNNPGKLLELPGGRGAALGGAAGAVIGEPTAGAAVGAVGELAVRGGVGVARKTAEAIGKLRTRLGPVRAPAAAPQYAPSIPKVVAEEWGEQAALGLGAPKLTEPAAKPAPAKPLPANDTDVQLRALSESAERDAAAANPLREELKRKLAGAPKSAIPKEHRSTVDALTNVVSSQSRSAPGMVHYPVEPDVAFKRYLGELPKPTGTSDTQRAAAVKALTDGVREGAEVGELIYRAHAAGASDDAIVQAVGVFPGKKAPAPRVPASDQDLEDLLRQSVAGGGE